MIMEPTVADIYWITEDLPRREPSLPTWSHDHGYLALPVRRNNLGDGHGFFLRLTDRSDDERARDGEQPIYAFERRVTWGIERKTQDSILQVHSLLPARFEDLGRSRTGWRFEGDALKECRAFLDALLEDRDEANRQLRRGQSDAQVSQVTKDCKLGDVIAIDGGWAVVVSNEIVRRRHRFGFTALVPLMLHPPSDRPGRIAVAGRYAVPEFLKICQPMAEPAMTIVDMESPLSPDDLAALQAQVRDLLTWEEPVRPPSVAPVFDLAEHLCLTSNRPRPWSRRIVEATGVRTRRRGAVRPEEPAYVTGEYFPGPFGDLRVEVWELRNELYVDLVVVDERLTVIDMLSVLSTSHSINVVRGPIRPPERGIITQPLGPLHQIEGELISISIRAPGITEDYPVRFIARDD